MHAINAVIVELFLKQEPQHKKCLLNRCVKQSRATNT